MWIRVETNADENPKIHHFAQDLGISVETALGFLVRFWGCVAEHAPSGDLSDVSDFTLEDWGKWRGDAGKFADALKRRFVTDGELYGWRERHGKLAVKAMEDRERKRERKNPGNSTEFPRSVRKNPGTSTEFPQPESGNSREVPRSVALNGTIRNETIRNDASSSDDDNDLRGISTENPRQRSLDYLTRCVIALNRGLLENEQLDGEYREVAVTTQAGLVDWEEDGIPIEVAEEVVFDVASRYRPAGHNRQPRSLKYFDAAVRERWAVRGQDQEAALIRKVHEIVNSWGPEEL